MLFFYIRHGDPTYDPDALTPLGMRQAEALARRLASHGIDEIYASSSTRAIQTATPTAELTKREIIVLDWCNEAHAWGEFTVTTESGRNWCFSDGAARAVMASAEVRNMGDHWLEHPRLAPLAAGVRRVGRESDAFFASLGYEHDRERGGYRPTAPHDRRIALFAHQGFGMAFLSWLMDIPYPQFCTRFDIGHSQMTVIEFPAAGHDGIVIPRIFQHSNDSHLYREGLPTRYQNAIYF